IPTNFEAAAASLPNRFVAQPPIIISGQPAKIVIPSLSINLAIQPGYYYKATNTWTLSDKQAQFATITALANNYSGNTFIYGHRLPNIFANLWQLKPSAE